MPEQARRVPGGVPGKRYRGSDSFSEISMPNTLRVVLLSFQGGRVELDLHFGERHARLYLDQVTDRYPGQPNDERVKEELVALSDALQDWAKSSRALSTR